MYLGKLKVMGSMHIILLHTDLPSSNFLFIHWNCSLKSPKCHKTLHRKLTQSMAQMFPCLFVHPKKSPIVFKDCLFSTTLFKFLWSTPKTRATYLLLQTFSNVAKAHTMSLAMTIGKVFWPFKWFGNPHFKLSTITWFCFTFPRFHKYFGTQPSNKTFPKTFSRTKDWNENVYLFKSSWMNITIFFTKIALHLGVYQRLSTTKFLFVDWQYVRSHVSSLAS
jgi:hypothetical protein